MATSSENLLLDDILLERTPEPATCVIFGASGDLTMRKLMPSLYDQAAEQRLPQGFTVIGVARTAMEDGDFRAKMRESVGKFARNTPLDEATWDGFANGLHYVASDYEDFGGLAERLRSLATPRNGGHNWLFYMTTPPQVSLTILQGLVQAGLASGRGRGQSADGWTRVIVEKPFGRDLEDSLYLNQWAADIFHEEQIYRIDHYLGKESVQNILVFRFANRIFEPVWNNRYIDHVQITVAESLGVENRASYYETSGALKDMVQNHMLQLLALVALEPPASFTAQAVRDEKTKVLQAVRPIQPEHVEQVMVRAQYGEGWIGGKSVPAYRSEKGVSPDSTTETYAALKVMVDNWRWADVPFYLRTGKRLDRRLTEIAIQFKKVPHLLFRQTAADQMEPNLLVLRIQPDEGISLRFEAKLPGAAIRLRSLNMEFDYGTAFGVSSPEAYERLLLDCMLGDATLFTPREGVYAAWEVVMPILEAWRASGAVSLPVYESGTWGPAEADALLERDGRRWRRL
jgi:glucose-6-phosphate 1-dehydrogenase